MDTTCWQKANGIFNLNDLYFEPILREEDLSSSILATVISSLDASMYYELVECYLPVITIRNLPSGLVKGKPSQEHSWGPVVIVFVTASHPDIICGTEKRPSGTMNFRSQPYVPYYDLCPDYPQILAHF